MLAAETAAETIRTPMKKGNSEPSFGSENGCDAVVGNSSISADERCDIPLTIILLLCCSQTHGRPGIEEHATAFPMVESPQITETT